jgi:hypothetical protein
MSGKGFLPGLSIASKVRCKQGDWIVFAFFFLAWGLFFCWCLTFGVGAGRGLHNYCCCSSLARKRRFLTKAVVTMRLDGPGLLRSLVYTLPVCM